MTTPSPNAARSAGAAPGWMIVRLGATRAALPIEQVGEVMPVPELTPVPLAPDWVAGITSVRGDVVAVVDAASRLTGRRAAAGGQLVLVHADDAGERVGLLVDAVAGLVERTGAQLESGAGSDVPAAFVRGRVSGPRESGVDVLELSALLDPAIAG